MTPVEVIAAALGETICDHIDWRASCYDCEARAVLAALAEQGYRLVRDVTPAEEEADRVMWSES